MLFEYRVSHVIFYIFCSIVAEGAIDRDGQAITCEQVKKVVVDNLKQDTR